MLTKVKVHAALVVVAAPCRACLPAGAAGDVAGRCLAQFRCTGTRRPAADGPDRAARVHHHLAAAVRGRGRRGGGGGNAHRLRRDAVRLPGSAQL